MHVCMYVYVKLLKLQLLRLEPWRKYGGRRNFKLCGVFMEPFRDAVVPNFP